MFVTSSSFLKISMYMVWGILICMYHTTDAQTSNHQPKSYMDTDGKLFWNKDLPVYLRIAHDENDPGILLKNDDQAEYTNPIFLDTEGVNYIRTRHPVNNETKIVNKNIADVLLPVYADGLPPVTHLFFMGAPLYKSQGVSYYGKGLTLELESKDATSGVAHRYIKKNEESFELYSAPQNMSNEGAQEVTYYAVDQVGNAEPVLSEKFNVDVTAPASTHLFSGPQIEDVLSMRSTVMIQSEDSLSGVKQIYYRLDKEDFSMFGNTKLSLDQLSDGYHSLEYYAVDHVLNTEDTTSVEFYFDNSPPLLAADILGDRFVVEDQIYFSGRTKLKFTAVDNKVGVKEIMYSINNKEYEKYEQPFYLPNRTGLHSIKYFSTDLFGNQTSDDKTSKGFHEFEHKANKIYVDLTGPDLSYDFIGDLISIRDTVFVNPQTKIELNGNDNESGMQKISYSLERSAEEFEYSEPIGLEKPGYHSVDFYGYDNVNNRNVSHLDIYTDNIGPEIFYYFSNDPLKKSSNGVDEYFRDVSIYLAAQDDHVNVKSIYYSLNDKEEIEYGSKIKGLKRNTVYKLTIRAVDYLNNETLTEVAFETSK